MPLRSYNDEYVEGGVSVIYVTSELDGGELILGRSCSKEGLSFEQYHTQVRALEKEALAEAIVKVLEEE